MLDKITIYRRLVKLNDGQAVLLRPLVKTDEDNLVALFHTATGEAKRFLRNDVSDEALVRSWAQNIDYARVLPIVAEVGGRIVGEVSLHFGQRSTRHVAGVHIFLEPAYRGKGLGSIMLKEVISLARQAGLQYLFAEVVLEQHEAIKAIQNLGFKMEASIRDYFMDEDGAMHNIVILMLQLHPEAAHYEF
jgi:RimJ/RimL family protein N-acetyltransferase